MKELVADMKSRYPDRYVIFDVPPLFAGADALTFVPLVDHVVVVVREGETSALDINKALRLLRRKRYWGWS
jgi:protein-tyrosine kinase